MEEQPLVNLHLWTNDNGLEYAASKGLNMISLINPGEGFWVYCKESINININGNEVINTKISLVPGWNLRGFTTDASINTTSLFSDSTKVNPNVAKNLSSKRYRSGEQGTFDRFQG